MNTSLLSIKMQCHLSTVTETVNGLGKVVWTNVMSLDWWFEGEIEGEGWITIHGNYDGVMS